MRPFLVALTGGIGSGKSTVAALFVERGAALVDSDALSRELTAPGGAAIEKIRSEFGDAAIGPDGGLDRAAMRARVFADPTARQRLEALLHPMIRQRSDAAIAAAAGAPYVIVDVPLLAETGAWRDRADRVLVVDVPRDTQIDRVIRRSGLERAQVDAILRAQASREQRLALADDVIDNSGDPAALPAQVDRLHAKYCRLASER
ncbi:MAG TPA: dephospho-CoA kinase [Burkholderiaceae bacterium]|nr:dephospho-CoA kinase [Burkholderiaceae bacterium]